jgi:hypothetical protein
MTDFCIAEFSTTKEVAVIPSNWITVEKNQIKSWWPPFTTDVKIQTATRNREPIQQDTWGKYDIRVLHSFSKFFVI